MDDPGPHHVLSQKSIQQQRNVFIWCTGTYRLALGWRVDNDSPITVATTYRWVTSAVQTDFPKWTNAKSYVICPVIIQLNGVLLYAVHKNGAALSRESHEAIPPGDYGVYNSKGPGESLDTVHLYSLIQPLLSYLYMEEGIKEDSPALLAKATLTPSIKQQALNRDQECVFSKHTQDGDSNLEVTWIFPPFLGYELLDSKIILSPLLGHKLSENQSLTYKYHNDPDSCDLSKFMVVPNTITGHKDILSLFWENKLGIDVDDNYRIIVFEGLGALIRSGIQLKSHLLLKDGPDQLNDQFLRLHFWRCLKVSVCRGDVSEDYEDQEIDNFMRELGVFDGEIDSEDAGWSTPLGIQVLSHLKLLGLL